AGENVKTAAVTAKHEASAAKSEAAEAAHAAKDAATKAAHAAKDAAAGAAQAATDAATKAAHAAKVAAAGAAHAASKLAEKALGTPEVAALMLASSQSADPVIGHLGQTLHELDKILGQLPSEQAQKEAQQFMIAAAKDVKNLNAHLSQLKVDHHAAIQKIVGEHSKQLQQAAAEAEDRTREKVRKTENHLREDFALEKADFTLAHNEELKRQLNSQASKFEAKLRDELATQALTLERRWLREVRLQVDRERGGRLARLDQLETRLVALERLTDHNAGVLEESVRGHRLRAAVQALRDALSEPIRRPFARELAAVQAVAGVEGGNSSQGNAVICTAAASIPASAANVGVDTLPDLVSRFTVVAEEVRKVALVPEDAAGVVPHAISTILSSLMFRKHGLPEGDDVESILARTEFYLREEELDAATRELNQLKGWAKLIAGDWLKAARAHLEVKQALEV
ncbi:MAG: mitochondrial inner membrane protein Mitofilin, partial [Olpidium bornovanus]